MKPAFRSLLLIAFAAAAVFAQVEQAAVTGTVTDQSGAVVPGAKVVVENTATGVAARTETNSEGHYRVPYLHPGVYDVSVESQGFQKARVAKINLTVGLIATVDVKLEIGAVANEIRVEANAVLLEQQSSSLGATVSGRQLTELPLLGRSPYALVNLAPGVMPAGNEGTGPIINGGRSNTSEVLLDGAETRNSTTNDIAYRPPIEAVQEFRVITNGFSSEYGRSGGGVLNVATRSGTNTLHGSLYEFLRNEKLNANPWANNRTGQSRTMLRHNEYGVSAGGPVFLPRVYDGRNRTFFFFTYEGVPERTPDSFRYTVPTALERSGDFSKTVNNRGQLIQIFDYATDRPDPTRANEYTRDLFPGNRIPADRIAASAQKIMRYFPLPNRDSLTENFVGTNTRQTDLWRMFFRVDHSLGSKHRLFLSHGRQNTDRKTAGVNLAFPGEGTNGEMGVKHDRPRSAVLSDTVTFRPNLLGEFRASVTRMKTSTQPRSAGYDFTELGLPKWLKDQARTLMFPRIDVDSVTSLGPDRASYYVDAEMATQFQGHLTWVTGGHSFKGGADYTFQAFNVFRSERPSGQYSFGRTFTQGPLTTTSSALAGNGIATLLLGPPSGGQFTLDPTLAASQRYYAWYIQDDWKVLPKLTLNLGVRYEYQTPWTDRFNQLAFFDPNFLDPTTKRNGLLRFVGRDGNSRYQSDPDKNNIAPRVGLAWSFTKDMVFRAGYGLFYSPGSGGIGSGASDLGSGFMVATPVYMGVSVIPNSPAPGAAFENPFVSGLLIPPSTGLGAGLTTAFRDWVTPYNQQWNASIQRTLRRDLLVEIAYVGSRGQRLWVNRDRNVPHSSNLALGSALNQQVTNPLAGLVSGMPGNPTVPRWQTLRPFPQYSGITRFRDAIGDSVYHGMTLQATKQMAQGLYFHAAYTVSKEIDNVQERMGGRTSFFDPTNLRTSRSLSDFDRPQYLVMDYIYELPVGKGKRWGNSGLASTLLGNWSLGGVTTFGKGTPVFISSVGTGLGGVNTAPNRLHSPVLPASERTLDRWFDITAFAIPPTFTIGNGSRTEPNLRNPGLKTFDISLSRSQKIRERVNAQFRAEFFNAFNTPQFSAPATSVTATNFGQITGAGEPRRIQLGLRVSF